VANTSKVATVLSVASLPHNMDRPLGSQEEGLHLTLTQPILYLGSLATLFFFFFFFGGSGV
jgi:hypothetical protein